METFSPEDWDTVRFDGNVSIGATEIGTDGGGGGGEGWISFDDDDDDGGGGGGGAGAFLVGKDISGSISSSGSVFKSSWVIGV